MARHRRASRDLTVDPGAPPERATLGQAPLVLLASAGGLLLVSDANARAMADPAAQLLQWWAGLLLIWVPCLWRLARRDTGDLERGVLVVSLFVALFLVQLAVSPLEFRAPDEFSHLRTLVDIGEDGRAFDPNPLLLISPSFPGLEAATQGLMGWSGLDAFIAGQLVLLAGRVLLAVALLRLMTGVTGSVRIGALAAAIYAANPSFLFFDASWSYESLAIPFAVAAIWCTWEWWASDDGPVAWWLAVVAFIGATTVTHHLTALVLVAALVAWAVVATIRRSPRDARPVVIAAGLSIGSVAIWMATVAGGALAYLSEIVGGALGDLGGLLTSDGGEARPLFASQGGMAVMPGEVAMAWMGTAVVCLLIAVSALHVLRRHRTDPLALVLLGVACAYPATLLLRLVGAGAESSQRASGFLYLGVAYVVADGLIHVRADPGRLRRFEMPGLAPVAVAVLAVIVVAGATVLGTPWFTRMRGPYRVAAEQLSIESQGHAAAAWARDTMEPRQRFVADRTHQKLLASHGRQDPVTAFNSGVATAFAMNAATVTPEDLRLLRAGRVAYVLTDLRTTRQTPVFPVYYEGAEPDGGMHSVPWPLPGLAKWDGIGDVSRVFDSGDVIVYDVRSLLASER